MRFTIQFSCTVCNGAYTGTNPGERNQKRSIRKALELYSRGKSVSSTDKKLQAQHFNRNIHKIGDTMNLQKLLSPMRKAINDFHMVQNGDKIAVGISGGKDSLILLTLLAAYKKFSEFQFELCGITVDMGFQRDMFAPVAAYCRELGVPYHVVQTDIAEIVFDVRKEKNPCSLCAKMRRGALNNKINELGHNKLALGHHRDDVVETFLLSLFFEGRLSTIQPVSFMSRSEVTLIRPMIYIEERDIVGYARELPVVHNPCPADKHTQRENMKEILRDLSKRDPSVSEKIANALMHPERYNLWGNDNN